MAGQQGSPDDWPGRPGPGADDAGWFSDCAMGEDYWIADQVAIALARDPRIRGRGLEVMVQSGVVILVGEVASRQERIAAARRVWTVPGVHDVANSLTVYEGVPRPDGIDTAG